MLCSNLVTLTLVDCNFITESGLSALLGACNQIKHLTLDHCPAASDAALEAITSNALEHISLRACRQISNAAVLSLAETCRHIFYFGVSFAKSVRITATLLEASHTQQITGDSVVALMEQHGSTLTELHVNSCGKLSNEHIEAMARHAHRLRHLSLECNYGKMTPDAVMNFMRRLNGTLESVRVVSPLIQSTDAAWERVPFLDSAQVELIMGETKVQRIILAPSEENI
jgi:hypothetical protein